MFVNPNFQVNQEQDSQLLSGTSENEETVGFIYAEDVKSGGKGLIIPEELNRDRVCLSSLSDNMSMWLYKDGKIKIER